jgi:hypothetical protein
VDKKWTPHQVLEIAPNGLVWSKAKTLARPDAWNALGKNQLLIWGQCQSSGEKWYDTVVHTQSANHRCSCQEKFFPCRHVLALMLCALKHPQKFEARSTEVPPWVSSALEGPARKAASAEEEQNKKDKRRKHFEKRLGLMQQGAEELERWLLDIVQQGLSAISGYDTSFWEKMAAKMVDAQMAGIAKKIRKLPGLLAEDNWHEQLLSQLGQIFLFVQSFRQLDALPESLQEEVLAIAGVNKKKEELLTQQGINDLWLVCGVIEDEEDGLRSRQAFMVGKKTGRIVFQLDYAWGTQRFEHYWPVGGLVEGEAVFYPGAYPLRVIIKKPIFSRGGFYPSFSFASLDAFAEAFAEAVAANPWLPALPCILSNVKVVKTEDGLWLADHSAKALPLPPKDNRAWSLMALSNGNPITVFGSWTGWQFTPISAFLPERVVALSSSIYMDQDEAF